MTPRARFFARRDAAGHLQADYSSCGMGLRILCDGGCDYGHASDQKPRARGLSMPTWHRLLLYRRGMLALICLLLTGCGDTYMRAQRTDETPSIFFCTSWAAMDSHVSAQRLAEAAAVHGHVRGVYRPDENAIYVLTEDPDRMTVDEFLTACHEMQHAADATCHGSMWALLKKMGHNQHAAGAENR